MFRSTLIAAVTALAAVVSAQNYSTSGNLTIDLAQISTTELQSWCLGQRNTCREVCDGEAYPNTCVDATQVWSCTCTNGNTPNISSYQQSSPAQVCLVWVANCVDAHPNDLDGQAACRSVTCGNLTTDEVTSTTSSASATATATTSSGSSDASATASTTSASATATSAAIAMNVAKTYGTGIMVTGLLALFGLAL